MIKEIVTKKDVSLIKKKLKLGLITTDELNIIQCCEWSEFKIQSACYNIFKNYFSNKNAIFVQIDNGGSKIEGIRKKKGATGTQSGFPDVFIKAWNSKKESKTIFIEFKKIGGKIAENQQKWHEFLKEKGELIYFCNNIIFFEKVILKQINDFINLN